MLRTFKDLEDKVDEASSTVYQALSSEAMIELVQETICPCLDPVPGEG